MLLATATERNNIELATFLISKGVSLSFESDPGTTALKLASKRGYTGLVGYILKRVVTQITIARNLQTQR